MKKKNCTLLLRNLKKEEFFIVDQTKVHQPTSKCPTTGLRSTMRLFSYVNCSTLSSSSVNISNERQPRENLQYKRVSRKEPHFILPLILALSANLVCEFYSFRLLISLIDSLNVHLASYHQCSPSVRLLLKALSPKLLLLVARNLVGR